MAVLVHCVRIKFAHVSAAGENTFKMFGEVIFLTFMCILRCIPNVLKDHKSSNVLTGHFWALPLSDLSYTTIHVGPLPPTLLTHLSFQYFSFISAQNFFINKILSEVNFFELFN